LKYSQINFTQELNRLIKNTEQKFIEYQELLLNEFTSVFDMRKQKISIYLNRVGKEPFEPGYISSIMVEIMKSQDYRIKIEIPIWKCQRQIIGFPISRDIPGSKVTGKLITLDECQNVFREFIEDNLK
jgi:hypothetical protein